MMQVDRGMLRAYLDGELSPSEMVRVQQALANSQELEDCLVELAQIREKVNQSLDSLLPTVITTSSTVAALKRLQAQTEPMLLPDNIPVKNVSSSTIWESPALLAEIKSEVEKFRYNWRPSMSKRFIVAIVTSLIIIISGTALTLWSEMGQRVTEQVQQVASSEKTLYNSDNKERLSVQSEGNSSGRILFQKTGDSHMSETGIHVINADGTNQTRLAAGDNPTWSPGGQHVAFLAPVEGRNEIYVMRVNEITPTRLTYSSGVPLKPVWSPDGQQLAFVVGSFGPNSKTAIYLINVQGTNQVKLTDDSALNVGPQWSPDGQRLVFSSYRDNQHGIYVINADGSGLTKLMNESAPGGHPTWTPDGKQIAYITKKDETYNIYLMSSTCPSLPEECTPNSIRLTDNPALAKINSDIAWSPDGQRLAFVLEVAGQADLYVINIDGTHQNRLTNNLNVGYDIAWSPDGQQLAFLSYSASKTETSLYRINSDGTGLIQLVADAAGLFVEWLPQTAPGFPLTMPSVASTPTLTKTLD